MYKKIILFVLAVSFVKHEVDGMGLKDLKNKLAKSHSTGLCYSKETQKYYNPGESYTIEGICGKATCNKDMSWTAQLCDAVTRPSFDVDNDCEYIPEDQNYPFPDCCEAYMC